MLITSMWKLCFSEPTSDLYLTLILPANRLQLHILLTLPTNLLTLVMSGVLFMLVSRTSF
jgi:hypothetical protein